MKEVNKFISYGSHTVFPFFIQGGAQDRGLCVSIAFTQTDAPDGSVPFPILEAKLKNAALSLRTILVDRMYDLEVEQFFKDIWEARQTRS